MPPLHRHPHRAAPLGDPTGGADARGWRELVDGTPEHPRISVDRSVTLTMSDGVTLAATVVRPADAAGTPVAAPLPALLNANPYNRALLDVVDAWLHAPVLGKGLRTVGGRVDLSGTPLAGVTDLTRTLAGGALDVFGINRSLVRSGYVQVVVDVRGTGASHGRWDILGEREQLDTVEILDWIAEQPWCDGAIGMAGWSYSAINSLQAGDKGHPNLRAIFAVEGCEDIVRDMFATGGLPSVFLPIWLMGVNLLKWLPNPATLPGDVRHGAAFGWLRDRVRSPFTEVASLANGFATGNDPRIYDDPYFDVRDPIVEEITAPTFLYGSWHDTFARAAPRTYARLPLPPGAKQLVMGDGYHLNPGIGFGGPVDPPRVDVLERAWFDHWLKGVDNGVDSYGPVTVRQQGGPWTSRETLAAPDVRTRKLVLAAESSGTARHAAFDGTAGTTPGERTTVTVRPTLHSAVSRTATAATAGVTGVYGRCFTTDARFSERGAATFTTPPATEPVVLSGSLNLHLRTTTVTAEGVWIVTVNDVAPDGESTVLTSGALLSSNRAVDPEFSEYDEHGVLLSPHHPLSLRRRLPVLPKRPVELDIDLVPTEARLEIGHRLRIDVFASGMPRYLTIVPDLIKTRLAPQRILLDPDHPSHLTLRAAGSPGWW